MSMMAVGNTYAAMVGIESFMKTRGKFREVKKGLKSISLGGSGTDKEKGIGG